MRIGETVKETTQKVFLSELYHLEFKIHKYNKYFFILRVFPFAQYFRRVILFYFLILFEVIKKSSKIRKMFTKKMLRFLLGE